MTTVVVKIKYNWYAGNDGNDLQVAFGYLRKLDGEADYASAIRIPDQPHWIKAITKKLSDSYLCSSGLTDRYRTYTWWDDDAQDPEDLTYGRRFYAVQFFDLNDAMLYILTVGGEILYNSQDEEKQN